MAKKILLSFIFFLTLLNASAATGAPLSFFEQKMELEKSIRTKVEGALTRIIPDKSYIVDIQIDTNQPESPEWDKDENNPQDNAKNANKGSDDKKSSEDEDKEDDEKKEEDKKADISLKNKVTFDDVELPEREEEFVVLNKFGLEAPLIDDYQDFQPDGKILLSMGGNLDNGPTEEEKEAMREQRQMMASLLKPKRKVSEVEKLWKYNEAIDILKNLNAVSIVIKLSKSLPAEVKKAAESNIRSIKFNLGDIKPKINFDFTELAKDLFKKKEKKKDILQYVELASRFATPLGLILGVILLGLFASNLLKKYFELNTGNNDSSQITMDSSGKDEDEDKSQTAEGGIGSGGTGEISSDLVVNGVERFQSFYEHQPEDAILMVKKWIRTGGRRESLGLRALVQQMDNSALAPLMKAMTEDERNTWKEFLEKGLSTGEVNEANGFIGNQIVQNLMIPEFIRDPETYAKLIKIKPDSFMSFLDKDFETSCMVLTVLGPEFLNKFLTYIDPSVRERVLAYSLSVTPDQFEEKAEDIKNLLDQVEGSSAPKPFLKSLEKLIPRAGFDVEESLYKHYVSQAPSDKVDQILSQNFPGFLIQNLPEKFLKDILNRFPLEKKVRLIYGLGDELSTHFLSIFAPQGSKAYELMDLEFNAIENDPNRKKDIEQTFDQTWSEFVTYVRSEIKKNKEIGPDVEEVTSQWLEKNQFKGKTQPHLRAVA